MEDFLILHCQVLWSIWTWMYPPRLLSTVIDPILRLGNNLMIHCQDFIRHLKRGQSTVRILWHAVFNDFVPPKSCSLTPNSTAMMTPTTSKYTQECMSRFFLFLIAESSGIIYYNANSSYKLVKKKEIIYPHSNNYGDLEQLVRNHFPTVLAIQEVHRADVNRFNRSLSRR